MSDRVEGDIEDGIAFPRFVIEMPPLAGVHVEALGLHRGAENVASPPSEGRSRFGFRMRRVGERVVVGRKRERTSGLQIEEGEIDRTSPIVARTPSGIGDEGAALGRYGFPKQQRHAPRSIAVVEEQSEPERFEARTDAQERFGRRTLKEHAPFVVDGDAEKVAVGRVTHVEAHARVERGDVDEIGAGRAVGLERRTCRREATSEVVDRRRRDDAERIGRGRRIRRVDGLSGEDDFKRIAVREGARKARRLLGAARKEEAKEGDDAEHPPHYAARVMTTLLRRHRFVRTWMALALWGLASIAAAQETRPSPTRVWVLAGQSNMEGNGWLDGAPAEADVRILRLDGGKARWESGVEPSHRAVVPKDLPGWAAGPPVVGRLDGRKGASPGVAFAAHRARTTKSVVGIIPTAVGGTTLDAWSPTRKADPESLYGRMLARVSASGAKPEGILWYQGEADAVGTPDAATTYAARLDAWIGEVRKDLGDPELPVIVAQLCRYVIDRDATGWNTVQEAQRLLPLRVPRTECVPTIDLPLDDPIHLSALAERRLGVRFAKTAASLFGEDDAPTSGPRPLKIAFEGARRDRIVVTYRGVNGSLSPATRVAGFSIVDASGKTLPILFDAAVDPARPDTVLLRLAASVPEGATLWYGRGLDPVCNLVDDEDLAAPVFGPFRLDQR